jgi:hypothetical protein
MKLKRPNKVLEQQIKEAAKKELCPIHRQRADVSMPDENEEVKVMACCVFFKNDVLLIAERMRKDFIFRAEKTLERLERERLKEKFKDKNKD